MSDLAAFYSEDFLSHKSPLYHPENEKRLTAIYDSFKKVDFFSADIIEPREATIKEIQLVHTEDHIKRVEQACVSSENLDPDTFTSPGSFKAALKAAGSVIQATELIQKNNHKKAFCIVRPPGHHALSNQAMGFCLFNNVAIGAAWLKETQNKKVAILDFDAHHGNGTQSIFYENNDVLYCSWHQWPHYPGTGWIDEIGSKKGKGYNINIPLSPGSSDYALLETFKDIILPILDQFKPSVVIVSAGFDSHKDDSMSSLLFTEDGYASFTSLLINNSPAEGIIYCLEGGYDLGSLQRSALKCFAVLADKEVEIDLAGSTEKIESAAKIKEII